MDARKQRDLRVTSAFGAAAAGARAYNTDKDQKRSWIAHRRIPIASGPPVYPLASSLFRASEVSTFCSSLLPPNAGFLVLRCFSIHETVASQRPPRVHLDGTEWVTHADSRSGAPSCPRNPCRSPSPFLLILSSPSSFTQLLTGQRGTRVSRRVALSFVGGQESSGQTRRGTAVGRRGLFVGCFASHWRLPGGEYCSSS